MIENAAAVREVLQEIPAKVNAKNTDGIQAVIQFDLTGEAGVEYFTSIQNGHCRLSEGRHPAPDTTLTMDAGDLIALRRGRLNAMTAFMTGRLRISGDMALLLRLQNLLF